MKLQILTEYALFKVKKCRIIQNMDKTDFSRILKILKWNLQNIKVSNCGGLTF